MLSLTLTSSAAIIVAIIGVVILWSNPTRAVNRAAFICSATLAVWLGCRHLALTAGPVAGFFWLKLTYSVGALTPVSFWLVKESILLRWNGVSVRWLFYNWLWILIPLLLAVLPLTETFIPSYSTVDNRVYGWGYYTHFGGLIAIYAILSRDALKKIRRLSGAQRMELQVWLGGGCAGAIMIYALMGLSMLTGDSSYFRLRPLVIIIFYSAISYSITTHRIFDARQLFLVATQKFFLVGLVSGWAYILHRSLKGVVPESVTFVVMTVAAFWFASVLNSWLNSIFHFFPQATAARQAAFAVARRESRLENLEAAFVGILKGWGQTDHAVVVSGGKDALRGGGVEIVGDSIAVKALRHLRWVTPERLAREKANPERIALGDFLEKHRLGALVIGEGPTLTAFIGVGIPASRRPFTFPQVTQLMELASIIESALERAHFSVKAQHAEQLATVGLLGASLAHEIRNPLVSIKTFVQLLPTHHQDPAFRAKFFTLIGEEVSRIDRLTEQLLDLASPRAYVAEVIELHPVLRTSLDLVAAKATDKRIQFLTDFKASPDHALTDASAAKQVLLNLCFNAIQAIESRPGERWIKVSTSNVPLGLEMVVEDSGPGIAPEIRSKLFQPFHSTKSTGFGLGLAICNDILGGLNATISVDASVPGQGAVFRVTFPCPVLSSS